MKKVTFPLTHCNLLVLLSDAGYELSDIHEVYLQKAHCGRVGEFISLIRAKQGGRCIELVVMEYYAETDNTITVKYMQSESLTRDSYKNDTDDDLYSITAQYADIYPLTASFKASLDYSVKRIEKFFEENC